MCNFFPQDDWGQLQFLTLNNTLTLKQYQILNLSTRTSFSIISYFMEISENRPIPHGKIPRAVSPFRLNNFQFEDFPAFKINK